MSARRLHRPDAWTALLGVVGTALVLAGLVVVDTASAQTATPVELNSTWTDALSEFESPWIDAFGEASRPVSVSNVLATGDQFAKRNLLDRDPTGKKIGLDFILSGTRLTTAELSTATTDYVQIPVAISSLAVTLRAPTGAGAQGWRTRQPGVIVDPDTGEEFPFPSVPYTGSLKLNPDLLFRTYTGEGLELMAQASFKADNNAQFEQRSGVFTAAIGRVDPGAIPKNLRAYFGANNATGLAQVYSNLKIDPAALRPEEWPFLSKPTRSNNSSLVNSLVQPITPDGTVAAGGTVGVLDLVNARAAITKYPLIDLRIAEIQNAAKTWVAPSKDAVLAGINAGIGTGSPAATFLENAALTNATLTNAYPLTWLQWLIVPSKGLAPDKANAVASIVRFLVTAGQNDLDKAGTPKLPTALVTSALKSADDLVTANCTDAAFRLVTRNDAGPFAPAATALPTGTTTAYCEKIPVVPTTTTTRPPATTTTTSTTTTTRPVATTTTVTAPPTTIAVDDQPPTQVLGSTQFRPTVVTSPPTTQPPPPTTTVEVAAPTTTVDPAASSPPPVVEATTLPLELPVTDRPQFDRVTTMGMGGACLFGALRRYKRRLPS